jgi:NAD(P)H dehydrogenase (quinone)
MRECRTYGSVRGARSNARPYRDTYGGSWWLERIALGDPARKIVSRAVRALCARHCRVDWYAHYSMDHSTPRQLARFLDRVQAGIRRL